VFVKKSYQNSFFATNQERDFNDDIYTIFKFSSPVFIIFSKSDFPNFILLFDENPKLLVGHTPSILGVLKFYLVFYLDKFCFNLTLSKTI